MEQLAIGFWGAFFGTAALMLAGSVYAYTHSLQRIAVNAALAALASGAFALAFLGALPIDDPDTLARLLAHTECVVAPMLTYMLFAVQGGLRQHRMRQRTSAALIALGALVMLGGWLVAPIDALAASTVMAGALAVLTLVQCLRNAIRGDRLAWSAVVGVVFLLIGLSGLSMIALNRAEATWPVHAVSAIAGTAYLVTMVSVMWSRYSYLIELHQVRTYGPSYDPITRMRSHSGTGRLVSDAFERHRRKPSPLGVIVVSIANLSVLEQLYGRAAANHALFVSASRLRRSMPGDVEMGRLANDGFLLLVRDGGDTGRLIQLARAVQARISKPLVLNTQLEADFAESGRMPWLAEVGVGVLKVSQADARGSTAVSQARGISRTAWTYPSRVAWFDEKSGEIAGMQVVETDPPEIESMPFWRRSF